MQQFKCMDTYKSTYLDLYMNVKYCCFIVTFVWVVDCQR